ncbi:hypothetical protein ACFOD9_02465 [Novosphingobium bradum]|uniref:Uncharacterized protein n=1 Tax=Novosphingobium bradum TaxID=1737444 RepID=A0ABV7IR04_9SPHN
MKNLKHTMPRLRQPHFVALTPWCGERGHAGRAVGVMTPTELRAEVLAILG